MTAPTFSRWSKGLYITLGHLCLGAYWFEGNWQVSLARLDPKLSVQEGGSHGG